MADTDLASISQRLDRIEQLLAQIRLPPFVDPAPEDIARLRPDVFQLRLIDLIRNIVIKGDPPPSDFSRLGSDVEARAAQLFQRRPGWIADPPPEDFLNLRLLDLIRRWRGGTTDPAPEDLANVKLGDLFRHFPPIHQPGDPGPEDIARLSRQEVEDQIHKVSAEVVRLQSLGKLLNERLGQLQKG